jgi:hypothetical protein
MESQKGKLTGNYFKLPTFNQIDDIKKTGASLLETQFNEIASTTSGSSSLPFRMANDNPGIIQSIMEMIGLPNPTGRSTANTGDVIDMTDIWDFENFKFPLDVKTKIEKTDLYDQVVGNLTPSEIGIHKGAIPGLSQIKPPASVDENIGTDLASSALKHMTSFGPVSGYPLLKGAAYSFSAGRLYVARAYDFLLQLIEAKNKGQIDMYFVEHGK